MGITPIWSFIKRFLSLNLNKTKCVWDINEIFYLFDYSFAIMEYNIGQVSAAASLGGAYTGCSIFHDSGE